MAYTVNGKVYSEHALMDEIVYHTKKILKDIVIKNRRLADSYETKQSVEESNIYMSILDNDIDIYTYPFTEELLREYGYDKYKAREYVHNVDLIPPDEAADLLDWACIKYLSEYEEKNFYYRMLNGLPKYGTDEYNIYLDPMNPKLEEDDCNTDFPWRDAEGNRVPLHMFTTDQINTLEALGIMDDYINEHKGDDNYNYLQYLTLRNIPIYQARKADEWDILYIPKVEYLVRTRFAELYYINRQIYYRNFNQLAFTFNQDYFEELTIAIIVSQTLADMIVDIPEWYIRRDIFDLRSCQYFLDSMGVKFFKQIPLKYQIRIVKNINKLIRYKSTNKNMWDIINLFNADQDVVIYKYYLLKDWIGRYKVDNTEAVEIPWEMDDVYDFLDEENSEGPLPWGDYIRDFGCEETDNFEFVDGVYVYNFGYEAGYMDPEYIIPEKYAEPVHLEWDMPDVLDYGLEEEDNFLAERPEDDNFGYMDKDEFLFSKGAYYYDFEEEYVIYDTEEFDFFDEELDAEGGADTITPDAVILDFWDEDLDGIFNPKKAPMYDFGNADGDDLSKIDETIKRIEADEEMKVIFDEYKNLYSLEFIKVPIGDNYDDYIKDNMNRIDYDMITFMDKYWDGEDTHSYVKNQHMQKDFTVEGTKYMGLEYNVDMQEYQAQIPYFLGMIFQSTTEIGDIRIELPMIGGGSFTLTDIFIFLQCISAAFYNRTQMIHLPEFIKDYKPDYENYPIDIDGGHAWTINTDKPEPELIPIDQAWVLPNLDFGYEEDTEWRDSLPDLDFGEEEVDVIITPDIYDQFEFDFDYIDPAHPEGPQEVYDYGYYFYEDDGVNYEFEEDENYDFIYEIPDDEDIYNIRKVYDYNLLYQEANPEDMDNPDPDGEKKTVYETLLRPTNPDQFIPENMDFGEEDDEVWNCPQANNLYGVDVIDFGYHSNVSDDPDVWDYGITYSYTEYIVEEEYETDDGEYPWSGLPPEYYELDIDGNPIKLTRRTMLNIDGGKGRWSEVRHEDFYDWLRWDNPWQFISESNRIYGFNLDADLGLLAERVGVRHSNFGFKRGFTLEELGVADFIATDEIENVNDLLEVYQTNIKCYWNLRKRLEFPNSRDEFVTAQYVFMYLFTKPFDQELYRLKCGDIATSLPEVLKQRSLMLYKYYDKLIAEPDLDARQDFIRASLNDISNTLEYYIKGDNLRYVFEWIPTYSFSAIADYINMMICFFKSWKVYMLDPVVSYNIKDRVNNRTIIADQMTSIKETKQVYDSDEERDVMVKILQTSTFDEHTGSCCQEVIDGYGYYVRNPLSPLEYDGGYPDTEVEHDPLEDDMEWNDSDLDGGDISRDASATYNVDGGIAGARMYLNEIDGGGPLDLCIEAIDIDGKDVSEYDGPTVVDALGNKTERMIDGGGPGNDIFFTKTAIISVKKQIIKTDVRLSNYGNNALEIREDGIYLYGDPEMFGFEYYGEDIPEDKLSVYDYGYEADYADDTFIPPDMDFGEEEVDDIKGDPLSIEYDFTFHADLEGPKTDYDYNFIERIPDPSIAYNIDLGEETDENIDPEDDYSFIPPDLDFGEDGKDYIHGDPLSTAYDFNHNIDSPNTIKVFYDYNRTEPDSEEEEEEFNKYTKDSLDFGYMADDTERYEYFKRIFYADKYNYGNIVHDYYTTIMVLTNPEYVTDFTKQFMNKFLRHALEFIEDISETHKSENKMKKYIDDKVNTLIDKIIDANPLVWKDFSKTAQAPDFGEDGVDDIVLSKGYYLFDFGYEANTIDDVEPEDQYDPDSGYWTMDPEYDYGEELPVIEY